MINAKKYKETQPTKKRTTIKRLREHSKKVKDKREKLATSQKIEEDET